MPKIRVPPDKVVETKEKGLFNYKQVSKAVNELYTSHKENLNLPVEERISNSLLPSNIDAAVSAENLQNELLGKSLSEKLKDSNLVKGKQKSFKAQEETKKRKAKEQSIKTSMEEKQVIRIEKRAAKAPLPPKPKIQVKKPGSNWNIVQEIRELLNSSSKLSRPEFHFEVSKVAAYKNYASLMKSNFDINKFFDSKAKDSVTSYGSEFKHVRQLDNLMRFHPRWESLRQRLLNGSNWKLTQLDEDKRKGDLIAAIERGNHKSAVIHKDFLADALSKEVKKGLMLVLPMEKAL